MLIAALLALLAFPAGAEAETRAYVGRAYALDGGELLFTQHHVETIERGEVRSAEVEYRKPSGELFAVKKLRYGHGPLLPSFALEDLRDGYLDGATVRGGRVKLYHLMTPRDELEERWLELPEGAVIDGGMTAFVDRHWRELVAGETVELELALPVRLRFVPFRMRRVGEERFAGRRALRFRMEVANPLLRLWVDPLELVYEPATRRLLGFEGLASIDDDAGELLDVRMVIDYPETGAVPAKR